MLLHVCGKFDVSCFEESPPVSGRWRQWYEEWAVFGFGSRLFCSVMDERSTDEEAILVRALPDAPQIIHWFLFGAVYIAGWLFDLGLVLAIIETVLIMFGFTAAFCIVIQLRKGAASLNNTAESLERFSNQMLFFMIPAVCFEVYILCRYVHWYSSTAESLRAAIDAGFLDDDETEKRFGSYGNVDIVWALWGPAINILFGSLWLGLAYGLGVIGGTTHALRATLRYQFGLIAIMSLFSVVAFTWAETAMAIGARRFQQDDGSPCEVGLCDLEPKFPMNILLPLPSGLVQSLWLVVFALLGSDMQKQKKFNRKLTLPPGKMYQ